MKVLLIGICILLDGVSLGFGEEASKPPLACGPRALAISQLLVQKGTCDQDIFVAAFDHVDGAHTFDELIKAAQKLGLVAKYVSYDPVDPALPASPVIVTVPDAGEELHFVVLFGRDRKVVQYIDYPRSPTMLPLDELAIRWDGRGVAITKRTGLFASLDFPSILINVLLGSSAAMVITVACFMCFRRKKFIPS